MICGLCNQPIAYDRATVVMHLDGNCSQDYVEVFQLSRSYGSQEVYFKTANLPAYEGTVVIQYLDKRMVVKILEVDYLGYDIIMYKARVESE